MTGGNSQFCELDRQCVYWKCEYIYVHCTLYAEFPIEQMLMTAETRQAIIWGLQQQLFKSTAAAMWEINGRRNVCTYHSTLNTGNTIEEIHSIFAGGVNASLLSFTLFSVTSHFISFYCVSFSAIFHLLNVFSVIRWLLLFYDRDCWMVEIFSRLKSSCVQRKERPITSTHFDYRRLKVYIFSHQSNWMHGRHLYSASYVGLLAVWECVYVCGTVVSNDWLEFCMLHFKLKNIWFRFYLFNPKLTSFTLISTAIAHTIHWAIPHSHPHNTNNNSTR